MSEQPTKDSAAELQNWRALAYLPLAGFLLALFGTYWDDAWHTEEGRDTFFIAPHLMLYAGISLTGIALGAWAILVARSLGVRRALQHPPIVLGLSGVIVTLLAAPIDNLWHEAFGRDSVVWSPPHMLGVGGSALIASALFLELSSTAHTRLWRGLAWLAGGAIVAVAATPVLEYETDVPQFDLAFYLPVLAGGIAFSLGLVRLALPSPWSATTSAAMYTAVMAVIALVLVAGDRPAPIIPLVVLPAVALDLSGHQPLWRRAAWMTAALFLAYVPYLNWVNDGVFLDPADVALGAPLAFLAAIAGLALTDERAGTTGKPPRSVAAATSAVLLLLALPISAFAHDPGQGEELTTATISIETVADRAHVSVTPASHCDDLRPRQLTVRRAGETLTAPLRAQGECRFGGSIRLPERGRWFVYAELVHEGRAIETWLAAEGGSRETSREVGRSVYEPAQVESPPAKLVAGVLVYAGLAAILVIIPFFYRRFRELPPRRSVPG